MTSRQRLKASPELPTLAAGVSDVVMENAYGLHAPAGIPRIAVTAFNREVTMAMNSPEAREKVPVVPHGDAGRPT